MSPMILAHADLVPFADLGTSIEETTAGFSLSLRGTHTIIDRSGDGYVVRVEGALPRSFESAGALLQSDVFADLPRIARNQAILLSNIDIKMKGTPVPISTTLRTVAGPESAFEKHELPWVALDMWLRSERQSQEPGGTNLLLIDGPAGVGKTTVVRETALLRASQYDGSVPLILQIASRGRVLQNILDLCARALSDVRANMSIEQLMALMRHGLVTLAIDGFDELSDPNGFQTAWSGLNNLIADARGMATFLLAGRETFVSTATIMQQLKSFDATRDRLAALSLSDPEPGAAREWLLKQEGWDNELLEKDFVEPIFVEKSYALRPFFLDVIKREPEALRSDAPPASDLLSFLVDVMIQREAGKFVDDLDPPDGSSALGMYGEYVERYLEEVARDLAENQSDSIAEEALDLLATVAADELLPDDQIAAVAQRARSVVFLVNDIQAGHVRFAHEQIQEHFLAREALRSIGDGELPRYVRRNVFGRDALDVFAQVARAMPDQAEMFLDAVRAGLARPSRDRTAANLAVLGVAVACGAALERANLKIADVSINELSFPYSPPPGIEFEGSVISILNATSADLRGVVFQPGVVISTLVIDQHSLWPASMPMPQILVKGDETLSNAAAIQKTLHAGESAHGGGSLQWPEGYDDLFGRIERYRPFWLRTDIDNADRQGRRIISHDLWPRVYQALKDLDLVTVKVRQAAGVQSDFVHFRQGVDLYKNTNLWTRLSSDD